MQLMINKVYKKFLLDKYNMFYEEKYNLFYFPHYEAHLKALFIF